MNSIRLRNQKKMARQAGFMNRESLTEVELTNDVFKETTDVQKDDDQLMREYCAGDMSAFELLYSRHKGGVYRFFIRHCGQKEVSEELFQDVWLKLVNARENYQSSAKFTTFLYHIANNRLIDHYRHLSSSQYQLRMSGDNQTHIENSEDASQGGADLEQERLKALLNTAIIDLPYEQREAFILQQESQMSLADIAEITGTSRETVKSRLRYAMNKLREQLGGQR